MTESSLDPMIVIDCLFLVHFDAGLWEGADQDVIVCCALLGQLISPLVAPQPSVSCYLSMFRRVSGGNVSDCVETVCNRSAKDVV